MNLESPTSLYGIDCLLGLLGLDHFALALIYLLGLALINSLGLLLSGGSTPCICSKWAQVDKNPEKLFY
jgi:hypothetical protein